MEDRINKVLFWNCNHRLAYLRKWHIQKEIDITNFISLSDNIDATLNFLAGFQTFWDICDLLDRVYRPRGWFVSDKPNLFSIDRCMLLNSKKSQEIAEVQNTTLKCFLKMAKREFAPGRWRIKGDETRPHGWKYPTPPCALAKILPDTTVRAYLSQIENDSPTTNIHFLHDFLSPIMPQGLLILLLTNTFIKRNGN